MCSRRSCIRAAIKWYACAHSLGVEIATLKDLKAAMDASKCRMRFDLAQAPCSSSRAVRSILTVRRPSSRQPTHIRTHTTPQMPQPTVLSRGPGDNPAHRACVDASTFNASIAWDRHLRRPYYDSETGVLLVCVCAVIVVPSVLTHSHTLHVVFYSSTHAATHRHIPILHLIKVRREPTKGMGG